MRWIVIPKALPPYFTDYFISENVWNDSIFQVIDLGLKLYTTDGELWIELEEDHL